MINEVENTVSFAPIQDSSDIFANLPPLPPEAFDMQLFIDGLIDAIYIIGMPAFGVMGLLIIWLLKRLIKSYDDGLTELKTIKEIVIRDNETLKNHVNDKLIHNYGRRDKDV